MKSAVQAVVLFTLFGAMLAHAHAQSQSLPTFEHVIIVIQENRSPDNLFGVALTSEAATASLLSLGTGVDLALPPNTGGPTEWCLGACFDPDHENSAWQAQYGKGIYNSCPKGQGVATRLCATSTCNAQPVCVGTGCDPNSPYTVPTCPQNTYVSALYDTVSPQSPFYKQSPLIPYFGIAHYYGFANYFYQTNQGPSQPAHDFLFGGTSAPAGSLSNPGFFGNYGQYYTEFAASNPKTNAQPTGCDYLTGQTVPMIKSNAQIDTTFVPPPCFDHPTLVDLLENANPPLTWKYYTNNLYDIWTAPSGIEHLCFGINNYTPNIPGTCTTSDFQTNVVKPPQAILKDFPVGLNLLSTTKNCTLPNVAWVIPNGFWSDHPGFNEQNQSSTQFDYGPDWVASVINAVGNATCIDEIGKTPWQDTVIFVVWDDWGGFWDHLGLEGDYQYNENCSAWGCGYTYGFRVPFLVVSGWTPDGYVSGACGIQGKPPCGVQSNAAPYQHDFGSILAFIENNFGIGGVSLGVGGINPQYPFADAYAPELAAKTPTLPLGDFFGLWPGSKTPKPFEAIPIAGSFTPDYFQNYNGPVADPDNDVIDND